MYYITVIMITFTAIMITLEYQTYVTSVIIIKTFSIILSIGVLVLAIVLAMAKVSTKTIMLILKPTGTVYQSITSVHLI